MGSFRKDNGKRGIRKVIHTATGYQCPANHPGNSKDYQRVMFYAKHVVGSDGHPYTEMGLTGLNDAEQRDALKDIKNSLKQAGFHEAPCLFNAEDGIQVFSEYTPVDYNSIAIRINVGKKGISKIVEILSNFIFKASVEFVKEQEEEDDVIFHSILSSMGRELDRGPGGHQHAIEKAHELAMEFEEGFAA